MSNVKEIKEIFSAVMHPEINASLLDLGMIEVKQAQGNIQVFLKLPFLYVPIRQMLEDMVKNALEDKNIEYEFGVQEMTEEERENFMKMARENWIG